MKINYKKIILIIFILIIFLSMFSKKIIFHIFNELAEPEFKIIKSENLPRDIVLNIEAIHDPIFPLGEDTTIKTLIHKKITLN